MAGENQQAGQAKPEQKKYNPLYDPKTDNLPIDETVQKEIINKPQADPSGVDRKDAAFLELIVAKIGAGEINFLNPESLVNKAVYERLDEAAQGRIDQNLYNLIGILRQIKDLWDNGFRDSFQIQNLVHHIRVTKERIEKDYGDIFII